MELGTGYCKRGLFSVNSFGHRTHLLDPGLIHPLDLCVVKEIVFFSAVRTCAQTPSSFLPPVKFSDDNFYILLY